MTEQDIARRKFYQSLMTVSHRDYASALVPLREAFEADPDFIARACVHLAMGNTTVRDQEDAACITLLTAPSDYPEYREAGRALVLGSDVYQTDPDGIPGIDPYRIFRVVRHVSSNGNQSPRLMKNLARDYMRFLEKNPMRFDGVAVQKKAEMKWLYTHFHIKPDERAQAILFDNNPPEDSKSGIIKQIAHSTDRVEQAELIVKHKIPYRIAFSIVPKDSPEIGVAMIAAMSPTEALNSRRWVEKSGLLNIPEVRDAYTTKVSKASRSVASAEHRKSAQGGDERVQKAVEQAKQESVDKAASIENDLLIMVDKSSSMDAAINVAMQFGARIAPLCANDLMVTSFNAYGQVIETPGDRGSLAEWQQTFKGIRAGGATSIQRGFEAAIQAGFMPQSVVLISDCDENRGDFPAAVRAYAENSGVDLHVVIVALGRHRYNHPERLSGILEESGLRVDLLEWQDDYYLFDQAAAILTGKRGKTIIEQILETPLPRIVK